MLGSGILGGGGGGLFGQTQTPQAGGLGALGGGLGTSTSTAGGGLFGRQAGGLFGAGTSTGGGLGGGGTGLFGQTPTSQVAGGNLFGAGGGGILGGGGGGGGGLFQSPQAALGAQKPGGFGAGGLFGPSPSLAAGGTAGGLFGQSTPQLRTSTALGGGLGVGGVGTTGMFGTAGTGLGLTSGLGLPAASGTTVKFEPVAGSDTVIKNGLTQSVNTKLQCVTAMKHYEDKSLEELRAEDYTAGRKGSTTLGGLGAASGLFGTQQTQQPGLGGTGAGLFGQKTLGGGLGGAVGGLFGQQAGQQVGQQAGQLAGLGATGGGLFGTQQKVGGGLFTAGTQQTGGLGGGGLFGGQTGQQGGGLFGGQQRPGGLFGQTGGTSAGLGLGGSQLTGGLFNKPGGLGTGGLGTGGLGTATTGLTGLGGLQQTSQGGGIGGNLGLFNKPQTSLGQPGALGGTLGLGQATTGGLGGLGMGLGGGGLGTTGLGLGQAKTGLGAVGLGGGLGIGVGTGGIGGLGGGQLGLGQGQTLAQSQLQALTAQQQEAQLKQQLEILAASPFGDSPLFRSAISDAAKQKTPKSGATPAVSKSSAKLTPHYKLNVRAAPKFQTISLSSPSQHRGRSKLFEGLDDSSASSGGGVGGGETFVPRRSVKKLTIRPKPSPPPLPDSTSPPHTDPLAPPVSVAPPPGTATPSPSSHTSPLTGTSSPQAAFVTPKPSKDESFESPNLRLGTSFTNPIEKPIPVRPPPASAPTPTGGEMSLVTTSSQTTPTKATPTSTVSPHSSVGTTPISELTRQPLRPRPASSTSPCGITLTQPGYYTIPPLSELDAMTSSGHCVVQDFIVGREGYGRVCFLGMTNVVGLNLDELVTIGLKEVCVYPDDTHKPLVGQGLNKRARVTLEQSWPICKTTHQPIRDPERLEKMNFIEKLKRSTAKIGGTFLEYEHGTGACVFEVEHFSKYKLVTEDSEGEEEEEGGGGGGGGGETKRSKMAQKKPPAGQTTLQIGQTGVPATQTSLPAGRTTLSQRMDEDEAMSDDEQFLDAEEGVAQQEPRPLAPPSHEMTMSMGLSSHRIQVMKASFFGLGEREAERRREERAPLTHTKRAPGGRLLVAPPVASYHPTMIRVGQEQKMGQVQFRDTPSPIPYLPPDGSLPLSTPHHLLHQTPTPTPSQSLLEFGAEERGTSLLADASASLLSSRAAGLSLPPPSISLVQAQSSVLMARHNLTTLVPPSDSMTCGRSRLIADAGLFLGRSFRVGWGPNWTLSHSGVEIGSRSGSSFGLGEGPSHNQSLQVVVEKVCPTPFMTDTSPQKISPLFEPYLATQLEHTEIKSDSQSSIPLCQPQEGTSLLQSFANLSRQLPASKDGDGLVQRQSRLLWGLGMALWGKMGQEEEEEEEDSALSDQSSYVHCLSRRKAVSEWLMEATRPAVEREVSSAGETDADYLGALFSLVSGRQIAAACKLAHFHKDNKLALLLGQVASGSVSSRQLAYEQLDRWRRMGVHRHISQERLRLFALLGGLMVWEYEEGEEEGEEGGEVNLCRGLDWKRVFGLHLWYCCSPTSRVTEAVAQFTRAFSDDDAYTYPPLPHYLEAGLATPPPADGCLTLDTCYHLLQLYCARDHSLEQTLDPAASTPFRLDYRISWHLWSVLQSLHFSHAYPSTLSHLHISFSSQLETVGLWHWAVFVLLHLSPSSVREGGVRGVLERWCSGEEGMEEEEVFVVERLKVPVQWVYSAKAQRACYDGNYRQQAKHLLQAGQWNNAHTVIIDHFAANDIINGDTVSLQQMLTVLSDSHRSADIQNWDSAGSGYLDYLQISSRLQRMAQEAEEVGIYELEELLSGLNHLSLRIRHLPARNPRETLCQAEMAKRTAAYTRVVSDLKHSLIGADVGSHPSREMSHTLTPLPMPSDSTLSEYRQLLQPHIMELAI